MAPSASWPASNASRRYPKGVSRRGGRSRWWRGATRKDATAASLDRAASRDGWIPRSSRRWRRDDLGIHPSREAARSKEAAVASFLVAPRHHRERPPRRDTPFGYRLEAFEAGQDAEGAIQRTALRHGVDMGACHDRPSPRI